MNSNNFAAVAGIAALFASTVAYADPAQPVNCSDGYKVTYSNEAATGPNERDHMGREMRIGGVVVGDLARWPDGTLVMFPDAYPGEVFTVRDHASGGAKLAVIWKGKGTGLTVFKTRMCNVKSD